MKVGGAGNFTDNKQIRMVQENVWIAISNSGMRVHALFQFRNEGPATRVTMAFPDGIMDYKPRQPSRPQAIRWLKSTVDGKPTPVKRLQLRQPAQNLDNPYTHVWLKDVAFRANQTRLVTVDYEASHGDIGDYIRDIYTLKTGAAWKGKIGRAVFTVDWSALRNQMDPEIRASDLVNSEEVHLKLHSLTPRSVKFELRDIEPAFDIEMSWAPTFWNFFVNKRRVAGIPVSDGRVTFIKGAGSDPKIQTTNAWKLFRRDNPTIEESVSMMVNGRLMECEEGKLLVDGEPLHFRRKPTKDEDGTWVYVRDLIAALGGTYRYDAKWDRAMIGGIRVKFE